MMLVVWLCRLGDLLSRGVAAMMILAIRCYQWTLSPLLGDVCRFQPSCSRYFVDAVRKYGPWRGAIKGLHRIARCNPWNPGGDDPA